MNIDQYEPKLCMNNLLKCKNMVSNVGEALVVSRNGRGQAPPLQTSSP